MTTQGVGWAFEEASDLVAPPLNLVLNIHLRMFAYTSNVLITSFEYMDSMLASGTLKNFRFLLKSRLSTDRAPVIKLIYSTFQPRRCITVLMALRREAYWFSAVLLAMTRYRSQQSDILLCSRIQKVPALSPTGGRTAISSGRILLFRPAAETFLHDCFSLNPLLDSFIFYRREGASHFTGLVPRSTVIVLSPVSDFKYCTSLNSDVISSHIV